MVAIGRCCQDSAIVDTALLWRRVEAEEIEDEATERREIGAGIFLPSPHLVVLESDIETPMHLMASRPGKFHPQPLTERNVNLSIHSAPIKQTIQPSLGANARRYTTEFPIDAQETC